MDDKELKQILTTKAPAYQRSLIEIPKDSFVPHLSSLTDYLDSVLGDSREMQNRIDNLVMRYRLGAVDETKNEHFGTVLPRINKKGMIVGGSVIYYNTDDGTIIEKDCLIDHLYSWYGRVLWRTSVPWWTGSHRSGREDCITGLTGIP